MERARYVSHLGRRILYVDYTGILTAEELESATRDASRQVQAEPPDSVLALLDLTGVPFGLRIVRMLGEAAAANVDFVKARAVVGLPEIARPAVIAVAEYSGRPMEVFSDVEQAMDWLATLRQEEDERPQQTKPPIR